MAHGEAGIGQRLRDAVAHALCRGRRTHPVQLGGYCGRLLHAGVRGLLGMDCLEHGSHLAPLGPRHPRECAAAEAHGAPLVGDTGEHLCHGGALVARERAHAMKPASPRPREELPSALGGLGESLAAADGLAAAVVVDADDRHDGHVLEAAAPGALEADPVREHAGGGAGQEPAPSILPRPRTLDRRGWRG